MSDGPELMVEAMRDDIDMAAMRAEAFERNEGAARRALINAYADFYNSPSGQLILADLRASYHDRTSQGVNEEAESIDHPWRAYWVEGQRSVARALEETARAASRGDL